MYCLTTTTLLKATHDSLYFRIRIAVLTWSNTSPVSSISRTEAPYSPIIESGHSGLFAWLWQAASVVSELAWLLLERLEQLVLSLRLCIVRVLNFYPASPSDMDSGAASAGLAACCETYCIFLQHGFVHCAVCGLNNFPAQAHRPHKAPRRTPTRSLSREVRTTSVTQQRSN